MTKQTPPRSGLDRRDLLRAAGGGLAATLSASSARAQAAKAAPAVAQPELPPERILVATPANAQFRPAPAPPTAVWGFDGAMPGPVLRMKAGETLRVRLENRVDRPLSLHWHGLRQASVSDGVGGFSHPPALPGGYRDWRLAPPDSGLFLYRPLVVGGSAEPCERGLSGLLIVEERNPPVVDHDIPLLVDDWLIGDDGALASFAPGLATAAAGRLGNLVTVNGRPLPNRVAFRPGARLRLRLANVSNARTFRIRFDDLKAYVIGIDGQPTDTFEPLRSTLPFAPGTRYDIMVDLPDAPGKSGFVTALVGPGVALFQAVTEGAPMTKDRPALPPIAPLAPNPLLPPAVRLQDAVRPDFIIAGGVTLDAEGKPSLAGIDPARPWSVNGRQGALDAPPLFSVKRGSPMVIALSNRTAFPQPLHVHGHVFRILHPLDDGWEPYFLDTVIVPEGRTVRIAFIADNPGRWLISSAVLDRFDAGLWHWFEVT